MRRLWLIVVAGLAFAPAYAAIDSLPLGMFGESGDTIRLQIVEGIAGISPAESGHNLVSSEK